MDPKSPGAIDIPVLAYPGPEGTLLLSFIVLYCVLLCFIVVSCVSQTAVLGVGSSAVPSPKILAPLVVLEQVCTLQTRPVRVRATASAEISSLRAMCGC